MAQVLSATKFGPSKTLFCYIDQQKMTDYALMQGAHFFFLNYSCLGTMITFWRELAWITRDKAIFLAKGFKASTTGPSK